MHEMSLAESIRQIIEEAAIEQQFNRVKTVWLELGELSCAEPEAMRFCFDVVMQGSIAHQAKLEIVRTPGNGWCANCKHTVSISTLHEPCPACGQYGLNITGGDAMRVRELEVE